MRIPSNRGWWLGLVLLVGCGGVVDAPREKATVQGAKTRANNYQDYPNDEGVSRILNTTGQLDVGEHSIFFQSLGTNGRTCGTCHALANGLAVSASSIKMRFDSTEGLDPIFRTNDGSNSPNADVSNLTARQAAYSMLINRGVIRVGRPIPPSGEFELIAVDDPYGFASAAELSLFRRPLPTINLKFINQVMWDGRETVDPFDVRFDLEHQANDATLGHAQAAVALTLAQRQGIVGFETALFGAQQDGKEAGVLTQAGGLGGPQFLSTVPFYAGIEDRGYTFTLYDAWANLPGIDPETLVRKSVARGQVLFNTNKFFISGVAGIADQEGSCATCHNTPNVGGHSSPLFADIGIADGSRRAADMPLYTLRNKVTGQVRTTTDPGLALSTGRWDDIGRFKVPNLRAIETRSPYFHSGFLDTIEALLDFYDARFTIGLSHAQKADLVAFIKVL